VFFQTSFALLLTTHPSSTNSLACQFCHESTMMRLPLLSLNPKPQTLNFKPKTQNPNTPALDEDAPGNLVV
jgi:hypothetical protein